MTTEIATLGTSSFGHESTEKALTPRQLIWRRFRKHRMALYGMIGFALLLLFVIIGSILVPLKAANAVEL